MGTDGNNTGITAEVVQQNGGIFIELMVDNTSNPMMTVDDWVATNSLNCSVMHDKDGNTRTELEGPNGDREYAFIVDLSTMEIVWREFGSLGAPMSMAIEDYAAVLGLVEICKPEYLNCP